MQVVFLDAEAFYAFKQTSLLPDKGAFISGESLPLGSWADLHKLLVNKLIKLEWYASAIGKREGRAASIMSLNLVRGGKLSVMECISGECTDALQALQPLQDTRWLSLDTLMVVVRWS